MPAHAPSNEGLLLVVSGPSGVGKTTIVRRLIEELDGVFSVSATTRPPTKNETDGVDYQFISNEQFTSMIDGHAFLEFACVYDKHFYGTPRNAVEAHLHDGRLVILDIDVQGAIQVKERMPDAFMIFLSPPSEEELMRRLRSRGREDAEAIARRFAEATSEIKLATTSNAYDCMLINDDLERTIEKAKQAIASYRTAGSPARTS